MSKKCTQTNKNVDIDNFIVTSLVGKKCWRSINGGFADFTISLDFGEKIFDSSLRKLSKLHENKGWPPLGEDFEYKGEIWLNIWCTWRILKNNIPIVSSDADKETISHELTFLVNKIVKKVKINKLIKDIKIYFDDNIVLDTFCDHVGKVVDYSYNWDIKILKSIYSVDNQNKWDIEEIP